MSYAFLKKIVFNLDLKRLTSEQQIFWAPKRRELQKSNF